MYQKNGFQQLKLSLILMKHFCKIIFEIRYLYVQIYHGGEEIATPNCSRPIFFSQSPTFFQTIEFKGNFDNKNRC
jgi:hypothetical protein